MLTQTRQPNTYEELGFLERLTILINHEATCRDNRKVTCLLRQAKLRLNAHPAERISITRLNEV
ncbi:MAG: IstB-like ATP-binding domain-containing protein [Sneathiella sp.]|nr:IstB-like ATP-binding domain-containing protein [Sneathiella sp.]